MNKQLQRLYEIASKDERIILGLMSGTSLDGLDIALCSVSNAGKDTKIKLLRFTTVNYDDHIRSHIKQLFAAKNISLESICQQNKWLGVIFAQMINLTLQKWHVANESIDLIASHGQTIYHAPQHQSGIEAIGHSTLQIADGDQIAYHTGIITLCDFRQKHIAAGGEGAPLSAYGDYLLYGQQESACLLVNIGGISNYTYLPLAASFEQMITSDAGPGNTLMNGWIEKTRGMSFDADGSMAASGKCHHLLLEQLKQHAFFQQIQPASTGPESFSADWLNDCIIKINSTISDEDVMATLNQFTAESITQSLSPYLIKEKSTHVILSGGGIHNPVLMQNLKRLLQEVSSNMEVTIADNPDAKEAMIFALLANEALTGNASISFGMGTKHSPTVSFGKICLPG